MHISQNFQEVLRRASGDEQYEIRRFFQLTDRPEMTIGKGESLTGLVELAKKVERIVSERNPVWAENVGHWSEENVVRGAHQFRINCISEIKMKLDAALEQKRIFYNSCFWGKITQLILRIFGKWNGGNTEAIVKAEDFLLYWDSRAPLIHLSTGDYRIRPDLLPGVPTSWFYRHLNMSLFHNYTPTRAISVDDRAGNPILYTQALQRHAQEQLEAREAQNQFRENFGGGFTPRQQALAQQVLTGLDETEEELRRLQAEQN